MSVQGRRVDVIHLGDLKPGDYGQFQGTWYCKPPMCNMIACLSAHHVALNCDGTITVTPSIRATNGAETWHGYLTDGLWTQVHD